VLNRIFKKKKRETGTDWISVLHDRYQSWVLMNTANKDLIPQMGRHFFCR